jgi:hypothetical protein
MSANKNDEASLKKHHMKGNFTGEWSTFHPTFRLGKGFAAHGGRWKQYT